MEIRQITMKSDEMRHMKTSLKKLTQYLFDMYLYLFIYWIIIMIFIANQEIENNLKRFTVKVLLSLVAGNQ